MSQTQGHWKILRKLFLCYYHGVVIGILHTLSGGSVFYGDPLSTSRVREMLHVAC